MLQGLAAELAQNVLRYRTNVAELKWLLYYVGDEPAALLAEWDWRWPAGARLEPVLRRCFDSPGWRVAMPPSTIAKVEALYELFGDQPPRMDGWADEWLGDSNLFYVFLFEKLDDRAANVTGLADDLTTLIHAASAGRTSR